MATENDDHASRLYVLPNLNEQWPNCWRACGVCVYLCDPVKDRIRLDRMMIWRE